MLVFALTDFQATNIFYSVDGGEFIDTGETKAFGMPTSKRQPSNNVKVRLSPGDHKIDVRYRDNSNKDSKVYAFRLKAE